MNCWLHRISHFAQISNPLLEAGFLSVGFRAFSSDRFIDTAIAGKVDEFNDTFKRVWAGLPRSRWALWNFLNKMKKGDMVVVPGWGTFSVYRIVGEKPLSLNAIKADLPKQDWMGNDIVWEDSEIEEADDIDIGFVWKVELAAKNVSRDLFATPALAAKLKAGAINACITDLKDDVEKSLKAFGAGKPVNMRAALIDNATAEWKARIHEGLDCEKFTKLVEWYLKKIGADFATIPSATVPSATISAASAPAADQNCDADVVARFDNTKTYVNVLVKFYDGTTPLWELNEIMDFAQTQADADEYHVVPWIVTSADSCSNGARLVAKENNVRLICMDEFVRMLIAAGFEGNL